MDRGEMADSPKFFLRKRPRRFSCGRHMLDSQYVKSRRLELKVALGCALACGATAFIGVLRGYSIAWAFVVPFLIVAVLIIIKLGKPDRVFVLEREKRRLFEQKHPVFVAAAVWFPIVTGLVTLIRYLMR